MLLLQKSSKSFIRVMLTYDIHKHAYFCERHMSYAPCPNNRDAKYLFVLYPPSYFIVFPLKEMETNQTYMLQLQYSNF